MFWLPILISNVFTLRQGKGGLLNRRFRGLVRIIEGKESKGRITEGPRPASKNVRIVEGTKYRVF